MEARLQPRSKDRPQRWSPRRMKWTARSSRPAGHLCGPVQPRGRPPPAPSSPSSVDESFFFTTPAQGTGLGPPASSPAPWSAWFSTQAGRLGPFPTPLSATLATGRWRASSANRRRRSTPRPLRAGAALLQKAGGPAGAPRAERHAAASAEPRQREPRAGPSAFPSQARAAPSTFPFQPRAGPNTCPFQPRVGPSTFLFQPQAREPSPSSRRCPWHLPFPAARWPVHFTLLAARRAEHIPLPAARRPEHLPLQSARRHEHLPLQSARRTENLPLPAARCPEHLRTFLFRPLQGACRCWASAGNTRHFSPTPRLCWSRFRTASVLEARSQPFRGLTLRPLSFSVSGRVTAPFHPPEFPISEPFIHLRPPSRPTPSLVVAPQALHLILHLPYAPSVLPAPVPAPIPALTSPSRLASRLLSDPQRFLRVSSSS